MRMTMRWYGPSDQVKLEQIRQIPGMKGIVSAIYDVDVGEVWPLEKIEELKRRIEDNGLTLDVVESVPLHEDIKLGKDTRDLCIANYKETLRNLAKADVKTVCYNFMPAFDWTRSQLDYQLPDGSETLIYDEKVISNTDPLSGDLELPGWDTSYNNAELKNVLDMYRSMSEEDLWRNLEYFIQEIMTVADELEINMGIHPDDPPWSIFGLPRIITNQKNLDRFLKIHDSKRHGITLCSGSLGADANNDVPAMIRHFGKQGRIHFAHVRNIKLTGKRSFQESSHLSTDGSLDFSEIMKAFVEIGFTGALRPDHGRMIWGEKGRPGYGLYDRALGATYLNGLWEAHSKSL